MNESIEYKIFLETFNETLNSLIENETVTLNRECISLPKKNIQEIDTEKEDVNEHFHQFKNDFLDEYREFRSKFLHEVKSFKDTIVNATSKTTGNQEQIITLSLDNIAFLKDQIRQKDKVIDSLINQSSQQNNYLLQKKSTDGQLETILKQVQSKERLKSEETEKIRTTENKSKRKDAEEKDLENNLEKRASHNENSDPDILKNLPTVNLEQNLLIYQTAKKTEKMIMKKKKLVSNKTKRHFQRKMLRKVLTENILVTIKNPW